MAHPNLLANGTSPTPGVKDLGNFEGLGPLGEPTKWPEQTGTAAFTNFLSKTIGILTVIAFIWFIFTLFIGAITWLGSGGDKTKLQNAQKQITHGLIGLIIVISAIFLVRIIGVIFGIDILNLERLIKEL